jgi:hypothetical protein
MFTPDPCDGLAPETPLLYTPRLTIDD